MMTRPFGPNERPDAKPLADNAIRRFREELRMDRPEFAELLDITTHSLRVWEKGTSKPRAESVMKIIEVAERNHYPLTMADIFSAPKEVVKKTRLTKKKKKRTKKSPATSQ